MIYYLAKYTENGRPRFSIHDSCYGVNWKIIDSYWIIKINKNILYYNSCNLPLNSFLELIK